MSSENVNKVQYCVHDQQNIQTWQFIYSIQINKIYEFLYNSGSTGLDVKRDVPLSLWPGTKTNLVPVHRHVLLSQDNLLCPGTKRIEKIRFPVLEHYFPVLEHPFLF